MNWAFSISYESRGLVIKGKATVHGDYDGPSKPEAIIRAALRNETDSGVNIVLQEVSPQVDYPSS